MTRGSQYVFGYGSLLERWRDRAEHDEPTPAELGGYRRTWNVAMDNLRTIPGYKYYVDRATGERGAWFVTFLNVVVDPRATVNGVLFAVTGDQLAELDERERNYNRIEVSARLSPAVDGEAWVYAGSDAAVRRFAVGHRTGRAVVSLDYYERVLGDFAALGPDAADTFKQLTDHGTHLAVYLSDPDGNDLELAWDRPFEDWRRFGDADAPAIDAPFELDDLLSSRQN